MNTSQTTQQLRELKLHAMAHMYETSAQLPVHQQPSAHELVAQLVQSELLDRSDRKTKLLLKLQPFAKQQRTSNQLLE